ncbi:MAG: hypothetical protein Q4D38_11810 [Planctomycetia bacterium]|nr:hypothetical protein [Planctomycetia bacterium]
MAWPLSSHFSTMLQNPTMAFRDPELKNSTILRNAQGQPKPWAGAFAVVYKATLPSGENRAVRVFSTESPERRERYELISQYLQNIHLKCLVHFEYYDNAIRSTDGKWYPLVLMDWVEGNTLFQWVDTQCKNQNFAALRVAADVWAELVRELEDAGIAHGDYQQANIMVTPNGKMKLVDYDCMCVPALVGRRNLEIGVEPYQHPERDGSTLLTTSIDRFSALMIYVALRALAADVSLWEKYVVKPDYDKLMFKKEDIQNPDASPLIRDLNTSSDPEVAEFTQLLLRFAQGPMSGVLPLNVATSPVRLVEPLLRAERWVEAVQILQAKRIVDIPPMLKPLVDRAYEETWKEKAWREYQTLPEDASEKSDRMIARVCNDVFLQQFSIPPEKRQRALEARARVTLLDRLAQMVRLSQNGQVLSGERSMAAIGDQLPPDYSYVCKPRVLKAKNTVAVVDALLREIAAPEPDEIRIADAWSNVKKNKLHKFLKPDQLERAELAQIRAPRIRVLMGIKKSMPIDEQDRQVLSVWDTRLFENCPQAQKFASLYDVALRRQVKIEALLDAVKYDNPQQVASLLADPLLQGYRFSGELGAKVRSRAEVWTRSQGMIEAMREGNADEFLRNFSVQALAEDQEGFAPIEKELRNWITELVIPLKGNCLKPVRGRAGLLPDDNGGVDIRWTWMRPQFGGACVLGISRTNPLETDRPEDLTLLFSQEISRAEWEQAGSFFHLQPEYAWNGANVIVWGVIDANWLKFFTQPLVLGQLNVKKKSWIPWR